MTLTASDEDTTTGGFRPAWSVAAVCIVVLGTLAVVVGAFQVLQRRDREDVENGV